MKEQSVRNTCNECKIVFFSEAIQPMCGECYEKWNKVFDRGEELLTYNSKSDGINISSKNNDVLLEKLLNEFKKFKAEKERLIDISQEMINEYSLKISQEKESIRSKENYLKEQLIALMDEKNIKETKTQKTYQLPSAKIVISKNKQKLELNEEKVNFDELDDRFIQETRKVKWAAYKTVLKVVDGKVVNQQTNEEVKNVELKVIQGGEVTIKFS